MLCYTGAVHQVVDWNAIYIPSTISTFHGIK